MSDEVVVEDVKKTRKRYNVSAEEFVKAWQESNNVLEVAEKLGIPKNIVQARSASYRKPRRDGTPGVCLKKMERCNIKKLDVDSLNKLV